MNTYPFGVPELLLPPPPPPLLPPPSAPVPNQTASLNPGETHLIESKSSEIPSANNNYQPCGFINHQQPAAIQSQNFLPPHVISNIHLQSSNNIMMLPASHLRLPPPPPPPPPETETSLAGSEQYKVQNQTHMSSSNSNFRGRNNQMAPHLHGKPHAYRGGPPQWVPHHKQIPSGLQGPWKGSDVHYNIDWTPEMGQLIPDGQRSPGVPGMGPSTFRSRHNTADQYSGVDQEGGGTAEDSTSSNTIVEATDPESLKSGVNTFTPASSTYKDHKVNPKDPRLPKELTALFEALDCKLCEVLSSSTVQAKLHYSGKPHEKKVRQWLQKWSDETGNPLPKRPKLENTALVDPQDLYCKLCDVTFTSVKHGEQHKMGKPHQKALRLGYSNHKPKTKKVDVPLDPSGRFGIGDAFRKETSNQSTNAQCDPIQNLPATNLASASKTPSLINKFMCDLCQISTTSQEHLDSHYAGAKHRKALVHAARSEIKPEMSVVPPPVEPAESILASVIGHNDIGSSKARSVSNDLSIYRTPSGQFYCHPCNTTVNSEKSFKEHTESKRHKFKVASAKRS